MTIQKQTFSVFKTVDLKVYLDMEHFVPKNIHIYRKVLKEPKIVFFIKLSRKIAKQ